MARAFAFRSGAKEQARFRQFGMCAQCGEGLDDLDEHAHHVVPNQSGAPGDPRHAWLASADNCVVLCDVCHDVVHAGGSYRVGGVAPASYFPHSHGNSRADHRRWVRELTARTRTIWS